jgi:hypothetical protein
MLYRNFGSLGFPVETSLVLDSQGTPFIDSDFPKDFPELFLEILNIHNINAT